MRKVALVLGGAALLLAGLALARQSFVAPPPDPKLDTLIEVAKRVYAEQGITRECRTWRDKHSEPADFSDGFCRIWIEGQKTMLIDAGRPSGGPYVMVVTGTPLLSARMTARFGKPDSESPISHKFWATDQECWVEIGPRAKHEERMFYVCGDDGPR